MAEANRSEFPGFVYYVNEDGIRVATEISVDASASLVSGMWVAAGFRGHDSVFPLTDWYIAINCRTPEAAAKRAIQTIRNGLYVSEKVVLSEGISFWGVRPVRDASLCVPSHSLFLHGYRSLFSSECIRVFL